MYSVMCCTVSDMNRYISATLNSKAIKPRVDNNLTFLPIRMGYLEAVQVLQLKCFQTRMHQVPVHLPVCIHTHHR